MPVAPACFTWSSVTGSSGPNQRHVCSMCRAPCRLAMRMARPDGGWKGNAASASLGPLRSALDHVDREPAQRGLLVLRHHVAAGLAHGLDHPVEVDEMRAVAAQGQACRV